MNKLGFGFLRLPQDGNKQTDWPLLQAMADEFLAGDGRYFDTAYPYLDGAWPDRQGPSISCSVVWGRVNQPRIRGEMQPLFRC